MKEGAEESLILIVSQQKANDFNPSLITFKYKLKAKSSEIYFFKLYSDLDMTCYLALSHMDHCP